MIWLFACSGSLPPPISAVKEAVLKTSEPQRTDSSHPRASDETMAWIPGGTFVMGSNDHYAEEAPAHRVSVGGFWMDRHAVTNADFRRFVEATGYLTVAERPADPKLYPNASPEMLVPASVMFQKADRPVDLRERSWWIYVPGADWRHPRGPGSSLQGLWKHPVVHVSFDDAQAYAQWAGKELPTEAEWEFAARSGLEGTEFAWGNELAPQGRHMANTWQGQFPWQNLHEDGFEWTAPVGSFAPNAYGLFDMIGNVWEWTTDYYQEHGKIQHACCTLDNPRGAAESASHDPNMQGMRIARKVMKGGSYLCAPNYCRRYRPAARMAQEVNSSTCHLGFRCISRVEGPRSTNLPS